MAAITRITVEIDLPRLVFLIAVGIGISGGIEPDSAPALAVMRRIQQPIDQLPNGVALSIVSKFQVGIGLGGKPGEVQEYPLRKCCSFRFGEGSSPIDSSFARMKKSIGSSAPRTILDGRQLGADWVVRCSVAFELGSFFDPSLSAAVSAGESDLPLSLGAYARGRRRLLWADKAHFQAPCPARSPRCPMPGGALGGTLVVEPQFPLRRLASGP